VAHFKASAAAASSHSNRVNAAARVWASVLRLAAFPLAETAVLAALLHQAAREWHLAATSVERPVLAALAEAAAEGWRLAGVEVVPQGVEERPEAVEVVMEAVMADRPVIKKRRFMRGKVLSVILSTLFLILLSSSQSLAAKPRQETFPSPVEAVKVMVDTMKAGNSEKLLAIFGPAGKELFSSGDNASDGQTREEFIKAYEEKNRLDTVAKGKAMLRVGKEDWPWPIPIVKTGQRWHFDTKAGRQEILARRIGENELATIQVCLAYVDAQREYARDHRTGGIMEYAQKFISDPGKVDGLCWDEKEVGKESPLGPLVGKACKADYERAQRADMAQPYHGYYYKMLKKQGMHAPGGSYDYVVDGKMIGGFALVAYPARYSSSGVMTFIVSQDGLVYQKDLGKNTEKTAEAMTTFDPDQTWKRVQ
jgi:hypothetical protein